MLLDTLEFLCCPLCKSKLSLESFDNSEDIDEGFLDCLNCKAQYPIIKKIPFLWSDFSSYIKNRSSLGGKLLLESKNSKIKSLVKKCLQGPPEKDLSHLEKRWALIYQKSSKSRFYSRIKKEIQKLPNIDTVLDLGCSVGLVCNTIDSSKKVIGLDKSFYALEVAKNNSKKNTDYVLADVLSPPFESKVFHLTLALNLLEIIEPNDLLASISKLTLRFSIITDPYDYDRGEKSVKEKLDSKMLRDALNYKGFQVMTRTKKPSNIPWSLKLHDRATLHYKCDLVISKTTE